MEEERQITCTPTGDGTYTLTGLSIEDLEALQEGLHRLFNESQKTQHRNFRRQVLRIDRAIDPALEKHYRRG